MWGEGENLLRNTGQNRNIRESVCRLPLETRVQAASSPEHMRHTPRKKGTKVSVRMQPIWILEELLSVLCQLSQAGDFSKTNETVATGKLRLFNYHSSLPLRSTTLVVVPTSPFPFPFPFSLSLSPFPIDA
jgi:hypothetical protein